MKKILTYFFVTSLFFACSNSNQKAKETEQVSTESQQIELEVPEVSAVCVWDEISVRSEPSSKAEWLTSINKGEKVTYLGNEAEDSGDKGRKYVKVRLTDGTEGWSLADFIIAEAEAATFISESVIYKRPDLLTKSDKTFSAMDIVAIKSTQDEWVEVTGQRSGGTWLESGWVKGAVLSSKEVDIAVAKFASGALKLKSDEEILSGLQEILDNSDLSGNSFESVLKDKIADLNPNTVDEMPSTLDSIPDNSIDTLQ
jgi:uncharacterized protein YgiM (DUF1202 family)